MLLRRALLVDRDPQVLTRLAAELSRAGYLTEALSSTVGLTVDLVTLARPDELYLDAELPGLSDAGLMVLCRSITARGIEVRLSTDRPPGDYQSLVGGGLVLARETLLAKGVAAFGVAVPDRPPRIDVRAVLGEVLGRSVAPEVLPMEAKIDLFSKSNFYLGADGRLAGAFIATRTIPPVGQKVALTLELFGRKKIELSGRVDWQRPLSQVGLKTVTGVGIRFETIDEAARRSIQALLDEREPLVGV